MLAITVANHTISGAMIHVVALPKLSLNISAKTNHYLATAKARQTVPRIALFAVWFVMFTSKFVFIAALDFFFGNYVYIHGFFGILLVVAVVTALHKLSTMVFRRLADVAKRTGRKGLSLE